MGTNTRRVIRFVINCAPQGMEASLLKNYRNCDTLKQFQREQLLLLVHFFLYGKPERNASHPTVYKLNPHLIQFINLRIHLSKAPFRNSSPSHISLNFSHSTLKFLAIVHSLANSQWWAEDFPP